MDKEVINVFAERETIPPLIVDKGNYDSPERYLLARVGLIPSSCIAILLSWRATTTPPSDFVVLIILLTAQLSLWCGFVALDLWWVRDLQRDTIRQRHRKRWDNYEICLFLFCMTTLLVFGIALSIFPLLRQKLDFASVLASLVVAVCDVGLYFYVVNKSSKRPVRLFCPYKQCGKFIDYHSAWKCGFCAKENVRSVDATFLNECGKCQDPPATLQCPHCKEDISLDGKHDAIHRAILLSPVTAEVSKVSVDESRKEQLAEIEFKTDLARMNTELKRAETEFNAAQARGENEQSTKGKMEQSFNEGWDRNLYVHEKVEQEKGDANRKHADNPALLQRKLAFIDWWANQMLGGPE